MPPRGILGGMGCKLNFFDKLKPSPFLGECRLAAFSRGWDTDLIFITNENHPLEVPMKRIISDKPYLILQLLSIVAIFVYLFFTTGYQHQVVFGCWIASLLLLIATSIYCIIKKRWILTSVNLSLLILCFLSLMILPYSA